MEQPNWKMFILPIVVLFVFVGGIIGIINWQKSRKPSFPTVKVNIEAKGVRVKNKNFTITGSTEAKNKIWINTDEVTVGKDGKFSQAETLNPGKNEFGIKAENKSGQTTVLTRTITLLVKAKKPVFKQPGTSIVSQPGVSTASSLATSGPADFLLPILGFGGLIVAVTAYLKSKKQLAASLRK